MLIKESVYENRLLKKIIIIIMGSLEIPPVTHREYKVFGGEMASRKAVGFRNHPWCCTPQGGLWVAQGAVLMTFRILLTDSTRKDFTELRFYQEL